MLAILINVVSRESVWKINRPLDIAWATDKIEIEILIKIKSETDTPLRDRLSRGSIMRESEAHEGFSSDARFHVSSRKDWFIGTNFWSRSCALHEQLFSR